MGGLKGGGGRPARPAEAAGDPVFLGDGGEMGRLIRAYDWASSPLGPPESWPRSLKIAVRLMLGSRHPMFIWWGTDLIQFYNDAYRETMGPERHPSALGQRGADCWAEIWPIIGPQIDLVMAGKGATWHEDQLVPVTRHGARQAVWWTYGYSPIDDEDGVGGVLVVCNDVTREHRVKESLAAANAQLASYAGRLRDFFEQAPGFMAVLKGPGHVFELTNAAYDRLVGRGDLAGKSVREAIREVAGQGFFELLDGAYASGEPHVGSGVPLQFEDRPDGARRLRYVDFVYQPIRDASGAVTGIFVQGHDVTARVIAEERQKLLADEMNHRVKNMLTVVQSLAMLTGKSARTVEEFQATLADRIHAMARTQDALVQAETEVTEVCHVLKAELAPWLDAGPQVALDCEVMAIGPRGAVSLGLIVHELLTNAGKYGALSTPEGRLTVRCGPAPEGAVLTWREQAERPVEAGGGGGFGTLLIERLTRDLGGEARMEFLPGGLEATIVFALV
ncbi:MAG: PAS domain-containing protein [Caulobacteraceae bacterium]|nr:PAS domain-containing protein [Caulobacteraceae bacterium]